MVAHGSGSVRKLSGRSEGTVIFAPSSVGNTGESGELGCMLCEVKRSESLKFGEAGLSGNGFNEIMELE